MLPDKDLSVFIKDKYSASILEQTHHQRQEKNYRSFHVNVDLLDTIKNSSKIAASIIGNYPHFIHSLEKAIQQILAQANLPLPLYGSKISIYFENCTIPRHNLKSIQFVTASLNQPNGTLVYISDAEIISIKESELYLQSWTEIWQYKCDCKFSVNSMNLKMMRRKVTQSLLDIITKGSSQNLKEYQKGLEPIQCAECLMNLKLIGQTEFIYEHCNELEVMVESKMNPFERQMEFLHKGNFRILLDKYNTGKHKKGDIVNLCCYFKSKVDIGKISASPSVIKIQPIIYLVCSYPQQFYLTSANNMFFGKMSKVSLDQRAVTKLANVNDLVYNYKNLIESVNQVRYPYLGPNTLTAMKLVTLSSIFSHQANHEKLHLLIITDEVSMIIKSLQIYDLSIRKMPIIYDDKTISNFFTSCHNSIVLISNPDKSLLSLINRILRHQLYSNINFVLWIVCEPEQNFKKRLEIHQIQIILDLTIEKNLNVCESVYVSMIDDYLECFMQPDEEEDPFVATIVKRFHRVLPHEYDENLQNPFKSHNKNDQMKQERLANDLLKRYFLKARQYKTTKLGTIETLSMIAESFTQFRYFIKHKGFYQAEQKPKEQLQMSLLDVILAIFIDEQTSRNKYSSSNTLFADEVSKIMLNENTSDVSVWDYEVDDNYVQETKKYIPRDQLVGMVLAKIFNLVYGED